MHITLYTQPNCQPCRLTKMKLDQKGIEYTSIDLTPESVQRFRGEDLLTAPVVEVDLGEGAQWRWAGYRPSQVERLAELLA